MNTLPAKYMDKQKHYLKILTGKGTFRQVYQRYQFNLKSAVKLLKNIFRVGFLQINT